jgi:hypothetical protein
MIGFKKVPEFVLDSAQARSHGARQIFAAFFIQTLEDAKIVIDGQMRGITTAENLLEWAQSMRDEVGEGSYRDEFLKALARDGFFTNSHPGFPLQLMNNPHITRQEIKQAELFEEHCKAYSEGKEDEPAIEDFIPDWSSVTKRECERLILQAKIERLVGKD